MKPSLLAITAGVLVLSGCAAAGLPTCGSAEAKTTLVEAFNQAQFARQLNLSAVEIIDPQTVAGSSEQMRQCSATVAMNNAEEVFVNYHLTPRDDGQFMLEFQIAE